MRFVVIGAGAIGGAVAARLHQGGHDVTAVARGAHLDALRRDGLTFLTPTERSIVPLAAVSDPGQVDWVGDEIVLLATKSQDTIGALTALRDAGDAAGASVPVVCLQNGVENERVALRLFERVYAATVMLPAAHLEPGIVLSYGARLTGMIDLGCYPGSVDELGERLCAALAGCRFETRLAADVMRLKHAKLMLNLANAPTALCAPGSACDELVELTQAEGRAALTAAGIAFVDEGVADLEGRWERMAVGEIAGSPRGGSSTWQSLARGSGSIETDYLNGEIVLQGALHGVATPANRLLCALAARAARERWQPEAIAAGDVLAALRQDGPAGAVPALAARSRAAARERDAA